MLILPLLLAAAAQEMLSHNERFDNARTLAAWRCTDPDAWRIDNGSLFQHGPSDYEPPHRSPLNIAIAPLWIQGDFVLEADLMQTGREYGHRDLCVFFGVRSPSEFLYAHLATAADPNAHHIQVVNNAPRAPVTSRRSEGVDWGSDKWRRVRIECNATRRTMRVFLDGEEVLFTDALPWSDGFIGFGSFDDEGRFDNVRLTARNAKARIAQFWQPAASAGPTTVQ